MTCTPIKGHKIVSIGTGPTHTAFLTNAGLVFTAGSNKYGQLGNPTNNKNNDSNNNNNSNNNTTRNENSDNNNNNSNNKNENSDNSSNNNSGICSLRPRLLEIPNESKAVYVDCGDTYTVVVTDQNKVYCWGKDKPGAGDGVGVRKAGEPTEIAFNSIDCGNVKFHSLSVCHNSTMLAGQVVIHTGADGAIIDS